MRMSRSAVVLVWLFAARPAAGQAPYRVTWRDAASVGAAGALALLPVALNLPHGPPPCAPCDPASVPSIDRTALRVTGGKHFPTDVAGGAVLGSSIGWLTASVHATAP